MKQELQCTVDPVACVGASDFTGSKDAQGAANTAAHLSEILSVFGLAARRTNVADGACGWCRAGKPKTYWAKPRAVSLSYGCCMERAGRRRRDGLPRESGPDWVQCSERHGGALIRAIDAMDACHRLWRMTFETVVLGLGTIGPVRSGLQSWLDDRCWEVAGIMTCRRPMGVCCIAA